MDKATLNKTRISFAKVLVDIKAEFGFPNLLEAEGEDGEIFKQQVIYESPLSRCASCLYFGNFKNQCPMAKKWIPKELEENDRIEVEAKEG